MQFFIAFIIGAVMIGAGALLSPAWDSRQPRIGVAAAMSIALVLGGAVFWGALFDWNTLVIDYLLFALVSIVVLGGTLSSAQARAEAKGEELADEDQGWTGPQDLLFFALAGLSFLLVLFMMPLPAGLNAPATGYITLAVRDGASFLSLAPYQPDVELVFSPGFHALTAYITAQLGQPVAIVQFAVAAVIALITVWAAYDVGGELRDKPLGRAMAVMIFLAPTVPGLFINGEYTALAGIMFAFAFVMYTIRYLRRPGWLDLVGSGLMLGAVLYVNGAMFLIVLLAYVLWLGTMWLTPTDDRSRLKAVNPRTWIGLAFGVPVVALAGTAPWLADILPVLGQWNGLGGAREGLLPVLFTWHGLPAYILAGIGLIASFSGKLPGTRHAAVWALGWLVVVFDLSVTGVLPGIIPALDGVYNPGFAAWYGPVVPLILLGGMGLLVVYRTLPAGLRSSARDNFYYIGVAAAFVIVTLGLVREPLLSWLQNSGYQQPGIHATPADVAAMNWIAENTPEDARILNYPTEEGIWAAAITARPVVYPPPSANTLIPTLPDDAQLLSAFWADPVSTQGEQALRRAGVDYVLVPQALDDPTVYSGQYRFTPLQRIDGRTHPRNADYLEVVFEQDGAMVLALQSAES